MTTPTEGSGEQEPQVPGEAQQPGLPEPPPVPPVSDPYSAPTPGSYPPPPPPPPPPTYPSADGYSPPPPGYGAPAAPGYGVAVANNQKAVWSLVLAVVGFCICGIILGTVAIILAQQAKREIAASGGTQSGAGMAQAGFIVGIIVVAIGVLQIILLLTGNYPGLER